MLIAKDKPAIFRNERAQPGVNAHVPVAKLGQGGLEHNNTRRQRSALHQVDLVQKDVCVKNNELGCRECLRVVWTHTARLYAAPQVIPEVMLAYNALHGPTFRLSREGVEVEHYLNWGLEKERKHQNALVGPLGMK